MLAKLCPAEAFQTGREVGHHTYGTTFCLTCPADGGAPPPPGGDCCSRGGWVATCSAARCTPRVAVAVPPARLGFQVRCASRGLYHHEVEPEDCCCACIIVVQSVANKWRFPPRCLPLNCPFAQAAGRSGGTLLSGHCCGRGNHCWRPAKPVHRVCCTAQHGRWVGLMAGVVIMLCAR